jgi:CDP-glucose 4,6-dehydratase
MIARSYHVAFGLPVVVSRLANVYGGGDLNVSRLVPGTMLSALKGESPVIRSDGTPLRDYIHVDDAVAAYLVLAEHATDQDVTGKAFNFGANNPITVLEMAQLILEACDRPDLELDIQGKGPLAGEIEHQYLDSSAAKQRFGWAATVDAIDGLSRTAAWYRDHL